MDELLVVLLFTSNENLKRDASCLCHAVVLYIVMTTHMVTRMIQQKFAELLFRSHLRKENNVSYMILLG